MPRHRSIDTEILQAQSKSIQKRKFGTAARYLFPIMVLLLLVLMAGVSFAAPDTSDIAAPAPEKCKVALLYINNTKSTYDDEIDKKMNDNFKKLLSNYEIIPGGKYIELLSKNGFTDISTAERSDLVDVFKNENIDYVIYAEIQPFIRKEKITFFTYGIDMTAIVPLKIIDIKNNKYLYNGKFTEIGSDSSMIGLVGNKSVSMLALDKVITKMNAVIETRLPLK
jgi:hypothetical protein